MKSFFLLVILVLATSAVLYSQQPKLMGFYHHKEPVISAVTSENGELMATSDGNSVILWSLKGNKQVQFFLKEKVRNIRFSKNGKYFSFVYRNDSLSTTHYHTLLFDLAKSKVLMNEEIYENSFSAFSSDNQFIIYNPVDSSIHYSLGETVVRKKSRPGIDVYPNKEQVLNFVLQEHPTSYNGIKIKCTLFNTLKGNILAEKKIEIEDIGYGFYSRTISASYGLSLPNDQFMISFGKGAGVIIHTKTLAHYMSEDERNPQGHKAEISNGRLIFRNETISLKPSDESSQLYTLELNENGTISAMKESWGTVCYLFSDAKNKLIYKFDCGYSTSILFMNNMVVSFSNDIGQGLSIRTLTTDKVSYKFPDNGLNIEKVQKLNEHSFIIVYDNGSLDVFDVIKMKIIFSHRQSADRLFGFSANADVLTLTAKMNHNDSVILFRQLNLQTGLALDVKKINKKGDEKYILLNDRATALPLSKKYYTNLLNTETGSWHSQFDEGHEVSKIDRLDSTSLIYNVDNKKIVAYNFLTKDTLFSITNPIPKSDYYTNEIGAVDFDTNLDQNRIAVSVDSWSNGNVKVYDLSTAKLLYQIYNRQPPSKVAISPNGQLAVADRKYLIRMYDLANGKLKHQIPDYRKENDQGYFYYFFEWLQKGEKLVIARYNRSHDNDPKINLISKDDATGYSVEIDGWLKDVSDDGNMLLIASDYVDSLKVFDISKLKIIEKWEINSSGNSRISGNNKFALTKLQDNSIQIRSLLNDSVDLNLRLYDSINWLVTHPSGLFDASPGAMDKLYFVQGLDVIEMGQLKDRYFEPGLWKKVMAGEELRNVVGMKSIELPPDIQVGQVDDQGYLQINLINRGGGIGEVNLFVNGKEVIKDARDANVKPEAPTASLKVFVGTHKSIIKGQENLIAVKAWNKDHWVVSRGQVVSYQSKEIEHYKPAIHILSCGVSDYTGNEIDLKYAAKDAHDISVAIQLGAKKLFGAERSYVYNLTTSQSKEFYPTKTNILKAFEKISSAAHPLDIFVMYVSGHGINYGGQDGDWHYLTQEAFTGSASAYNDPAIRLQTTISSNELVELFKKVPALKQVLMLDACASGKVVDNLMAQKDIESSTLRALDRMRDRTGMHIITGCTADAVSYEASKYGQGVLTYSLLEGIRGAALREDQYVDVNKLFQYAQDRVPQLAEGIGGIQSPQVFSPQGSQSFDIGLLSDTEKKEIPIAKIRPVYIRSNFQDENEMEDVLGLGKLINESLNEVSSKGIDSQIIFVDVADYPEGCKLIGRYRKENARLPDGQGKIILKLRRKCGGEDKTYDLKADDVEGLKAEIMKVL